jgi:CRISPR-associated endonuclease/helicase Cas3
MTDKIKPTYFHYWGKARNTYGEGELFHLLPYHCLDVAAVASAWWDANTAIRRTFLSSFNSPEPNQNQLRAWVTFFVALHDLGKFDLRFQLKAPEALAATWRRFGEDDHGIALRDITGFDHGWAGIAWAKQEYRRWLDVEDAGREIWDSWQPWLAAVTGHHGDFYDPTEIKSPNADDWLIVHDREARRAWVQSLSEIFLAPVGLSLRDLPPVVPSGVKFWLAGFCSVCDWIGSNEVFVYQPVSNVGLEKYLANRIQKIQNENLLHRFGLSSQANDYPGLASLLRAGESPRGVQVKVDELPVIPGLTLIEAPTGSGKTEAALAYAWRFLEQGRADSIVFALPTQATANAMLVRAEAFAEKVFGAANVVLAHGKSQLNETFQRLRDSGRRVSAQGETEAAAQCAVWLASSRKRVFLGQIGVCTVDQVLLSVLPVRHKFVRGFGLNKSVLIVDEVHAYDAYMHSLLGEVLRRQKATGGSAVLLSATLPAGVRAKLLEAWDSSSAEDVPYPALWHAAGGVVTPLEVPDEHRPAERKVAIECLKLPDASPDDALLDRIVRAAEIGARVAVVLNLVDDAQRLARKLRDKTGMAVDVFHARYRFIDRQQKEQAVLRHYGRGAPRGEGRILVATQVVEQSLDLDFDWLLTQICPVDLLFQRLGRLHRHPRGDRSAGFVSPRCTVVSVEGDDYGLHKLIYGNTRLLWRTEQLLAESSFLVFPQAYRDWIEKVYASEVWDEEPGPVYADYLAWKDEQVRSDAEAKRLTTLTVSAFRDEDSVATSLTRDGEMSLTVLPLLSDGRLLDGVALKSLDEWALAEALNLHSVPVPASWEKRLKDCRLETEGDLAGYRQLEMAPDGQGGWAALDGKFLYSEDFGLGAEGSRTEGLPG